MRAVLMVSALVPLAACIQLLGLEENVPYVRDASVEDAGADVSDAAADAGEDADLGPAYAFPPGCAQAPGAIFCVDDWTGALDASTENDPGLNTWAHDYDDGCSERITDTGALYMQYDGDLQDGYGCMLYRSMKLDPTKGFHARLVLRPQTAPATSMTAFDFTFDTTSAFFVELTETHLRVFADRSEDKISVAHDGGVHELQFHVRPGAIGGELTIDGNRFFAPVDLTAVSPYGDVTFGLYDIVPEPIDAGPPPPPNATFNNFMVLPY